MKRNVLVLSIVALGLIGCSGKSGAGGTRGKVDCYSIRVTEGGSTVFNATYSASFSTVYEYKSADGKKLYTSTHLIFYNYNDSTAKDKTIRAYSNKYTNDYTEYTFSKFVGFLTKENNYYLDLGAKTIDSEIKWSEYKYASDPTTIADGPSDNKEAYRCAKSNFYTDLTGGSYEAYATLRLDLVESSLKRHTYTLLGEDSSISYTAKWF